MVDYDAARRCTARVGVCVLATGGLMSRQENRCPEAPYRNAGAESSVATQIGLIEVRTFLLLLMMGRARGLSV